jgi:hypothetical protein
MLLNEDSVLVGWGYDHHASLLSFVYYRCRLQSGDGVVLQRSLKNQIFRLVLIAGNYNKH